MSEPIKIVIVLEGGLIQNVLTLGVPVEVLIVDYDTDGVDDEDLTDVPQDPGGEAQASVRMDRAEPAPQYPRFLEFALDQFKIAE